ncbi:MAG: S8 family serine peptidase, partial [Paludibacteraceae bacterium]|nr:S8 family serine peptidase [Paludibacteraceae bacterium]
WDGRIKPDIMAPGSGFLGSFDALNPFYAYVDYIRINNMEINFGDNNPALLQSANIAEMYANGNLTQFVADPKASNGKALKIGFDDPEANETYINWKYQAFSSTPFEVKNGDKIKIRMRLDPSVRGMFSIMPGNLYLASGNDFYQKPITHKHVDFRWNVGDQDGEYYETEIEWTEADILSKFLRIGFHYDYGIVSSVPCKRYAGGTCYEEASGTSMSAPHVSGVVALMNQAYMNKMRDLTYTKSLRNSTSKAILIHTAQDMVDHTGFGRSSAYDVKATKGSAQRVVYGEGPDFVTGWGRMDAEKALKMFNSYSSARKAFSKFQEFEVSVDMEKRWNVKVNGHMDRLRLTLAWDDAPGLIDDDETKKLQNDLDMYLISPSGKYYFPWRLAPLSTQHIDAEGNAQDHCTDGLENITVAEATRTAVRECGDGYHLYKSCFDRLNNVEVVDVDLPEQGTWIVVVRADKIQEGNSDDGESQIASIASDLPLYDYDENVGCDIVHPYRPQSSMTCLYDFGNNLANYVTFANQTFVGAGDYIQLLDDKDNIIGTYTGSQLAGLRLKIDSSKLKVKLESNNDSSVGYGFRIDRIETVPYTMLFGISH